MSRIRLLRKQLPPTNSGLQGRESRKGKSQSLPYGGEVTVACSALQDWIKGQPTIEIERKYSLGCGSLYEIARQVSRLIRAFSDITHQFRSAEAETETQATINAGKAGGTIRIPDDLEDLAERALYGLPREALPVASLQVEGLTRSWIMVLLQRMESLDVGKGLPLIERLPLIGEEQLKKLLPTQGLFKRLKAAMEKHPRAPLASRLIMDRQFILRYYLLPQVIQAQLRRGKVHYGKQDRYTALRVITRDGGHTLLRRNDSHTGKPVIIQNELELIDWVKQGAVGFYGEIGEMVPGLGKGEIETCQQGQLQYIVDRFFVDLDPRNGFPLYKVKAIARKIYQFFEQSPQVEEARIYWTGGKGFHILGFFKEGIKLEVQAAKEKLMALLNSWRICNEVDIFMEQDPLLLEPYLTLDLSSVMSRGIYRNELSLHGISGGCCVEVKIEHLQDFEPVLEANPESVMARLFQELNEEERKAYTERVNQEIESWAHPGIAPLARKG